jgi:hypothetical protein
VSIDDGPGFNQVNPDRHDDTGPGIRAAPAAHQSCELAADLEIKVLHRLVSGSTTPSIWLSHFPGLRPSRNQALSLHPW